MGADSPGRLLRRGEAEQGLALPLSENQRVGTHRAELSWGESRPGRGVAPPPPCSPHCLAPSLRPGCLSPPAPRHPSSLVSTSPLPHSDLLAMTPTRGTAAPDCGSVRETAPARPVPVPTCPPLCVASSLAPQPAASTPAHASPSTGLEGPPSSTPAKPENNDKKVSCPFNFLPGKASRLLKQHFNLNSDSTFTHGAARSRHFIKGFNRFYKTCHIRKGDGANAFSLLPEFQQRLGKRICHENTEQSSLAHTGRNEAHSHKQGTGDPSPRRWGH